MKGLVIVVGAMTLLLALRRMAFGKPDLTEVERRRAAWR